MLQEFTAFSDEEFENERNQKVDSLWKKSPCHLIMDVEHRKNPKEPWWIYAIFQRFIIDTVKRQRGGDEWDDLFRRSYKLNEVMLKKDLERKKNNGEDENSDLIWVYENDIEKMNEEKKDSANLYLMWKLLFEINEYEECSGEIWKEKLRESRKKQFGTEKFLDIILEKYRINYLNWINKAEKIISLVCARSRVLK